MNNQELVAQIEAQRALMIAVATGGPRIHEVNGDYRTRRVMIAGELGGRGIDDPNPYNDLWAWYGKWSSGDLPSYQSRRTYISELYQPLIRLLMEERVGVTQELGTTPTGWIRVDRGIGEIRQRLEEAATEEQRQAIGVLCREVLISLTQEVYVRERHPSLDGQEPSRTDAKRILDAYIAVELQGGPNETARKHARASLDLANELQHNRTASFREAALCVQATSAVVNVIAIISGRKDP